MRCNLFLRIVPGLMLLAILSFGTRNADASAVTFSDGTFAPSDWTLIDIFTANAIHSDSQSLTGGNPGAFRSITHVIHSEPPGAYGQIWTFNKRMSAGYAPSVQGSIQSIDYQQDVKVIDAPPPGVPGLSELGTGPAMRQGGQVYFFEVTSPSLAWTTITRLSLTASDFRTFEDANAHPDFSANGGPIEFGLLTANSGIEYTFTFGLDNWNLTVNHDPRGVPASGPMGLGVLFVGTLLLGLVLHPRRSSRSA